MNIFVLDYDPVKAAQFYCDKHVPKMVVELAQLLSTAHRLLDGEMEIVLSKKGRKKKIWTLANSTLDAFYYKATHVNHPCAKWVRDNSQNYLWAYRHFLALCAEYSLRFGKTHATYIKLAELLDAYPKSIKFSAEITPFARAMKSAPDCLCIVDPVQCYRAFYQTKQTRMKMLWRLGNKPAWFREIKIK